MNDKMPADQIDPEPIVTSLGAPPIAPLPVPRQSLHGDRSAQPGLMLRLLGAFAQRTGQ